MQAWYNCCVRASSASAVQILTNVLLSYNTFGGTAFMFPKIPVERSVWTSVAPCGTRLRHWSSGGILSFCKV